MLCKKNDIRKCPQVLISGGNVSLLFLAISKGVYPNRKKQNKNVSKCSHTFWTYLKREWMSGTGVHSYCTERYYSYNYLFGLRFVTHSPNACGHISYNRLKQIMLPHQKIQLRIFHTTENMRYPTQLYSLCIRIKRYWPHSTCDLRIKKSGHSLQTSFGGAISKW